MQQARPGADASLDAASSRELDAELCRVARLLERRRFAAFCARVAPASAVQRGILDLFCSSRLHRYVLAYMSVQEAQDWDTPDTPYPHTATFIGQLLARLGKRSLFNVNLRLGRLRWILAVDPLPPLRSAYLDFLALDRLPAMRRMQGRLWLRYHLAIFRFRASVLATAGRWAAGRWRGRFLENMQPTLRRMHRQLCFYVLILFPNARLLSQAQWELLLERLCAYLGCRIPALLRLLPTEAQAQNGVAKLFKVGFGVIALRNARRSEHEADDVEFILNSVRLAFSWGITYPLVDDVLDSDLTPPALREELVNAIAQVFGGAAAARTSHPLVTEVGARLAEVLELMPTAQLATIRHTMLLLLRAHDRDSARRLSDVELPVPQDLQREVWGDSLLKAALVRVATWQVTGARFAWTQWPELLSSAMVNQFGDDLWDSLEDIDEDRVTPFTLYLTKKASQDPFSAYFAHSFKVAMTASSHRRVAMLIGVQETARCLLESQARCHGADPFGAVPALERTLPRVSPHWTLQGLMAVPHVDLDAVVFDLAKSVLRNSPD